MATQTQTKPLSNKYSNRHKAYEGPGDKVRVQVLATKTPGRSFAHLGGHFKYDPNWTAGKDAVTKGNMCHHSGFAFPADGKMHEYTFPKEFAERLAVQAAELPDSFEVAILGAAKEEAPASVPAPAAPAARAATTEPLPADEEEEDQAEPTEDEQFEEEDAE